MYDERDKNINLQTNGSIKYISNTNGGVMQNEIYYNKVMISMYFRACVRIFNRWRG